MSIDKPVKQFVIGGTDFGIGSVTLKTCDNHCFDLEITASEEMYEKITEDESSE